MTINKKKNLAFFIDLKASLMSSTQARCQVGNNLEIFPDRGLWEADQYLFWGVLCYPNAAAGSFPTEFLALIKPKVRFHKCKGEKQDGECGRQRRQTERGQ